MKNTGQSSKNDWPVLQISKNKLSQIQHQKFFKNIKFITKSTNFQ